jgi:hypothetical protein
VRRVFLLVVVLAVLISTRAANAADDSADDLKRRGDEALVAGRFTEALTAYQASYAKHPDPALLYNQGRAYQSLEDWPNALDKIEEFDKTATPALRARVPALPSLLRDLRLNVGTLALTSNVADAEVKLNGRAVGKTPLTNAMRVKAGNAVLEITKDGYLPWRRELTFKGASVTNVDARLAARETEGLVVVRSQGIAGVRVAVDGQPQGTTPSELVLREGSHRLELDRDGYQPLSSAIIVHAGEKKELDLKLEKKSPITTKWWFWTGVGVVAVGAGVVIYALVTERDPDRGTVDPGRISTGLHF